MDLRDFLNANLNETYSVNDDELEAYKNEYEKMLDGNVQGNIAEMENKTEQKNKTDEVNIKDKLQKEIEQLKNEINNIEFEDEETNNDIQRSLKYIENNVKEFSKEQILNFFEIVKNEIQNLEYFKEINVDKINDIDEDMLRKLYHFYILNALKIEALETQKNLKASSEQKETSKNAPFLDGNSTKNYSEVKKEEKKEIENEKSAELNNEEKESKNIASDKNINKQTSKQDDPKQEEILPTKILEDEILIFLNDKITEEGENIFPNLVELLKIRRAQNYGLHKINSEIDKTESELKEFKLKANETEKIKTELSEHKYKKAQLVKEVSTFKKISLEYLDVIDFDNIQILQNPDEDRFFKKFYKKAIKSNDIFYLDYQIKRMENLKKSIAFEAVREYGVNIIYKLDEALEGIKKTEEILKQLKIEIATEKNQVLEKNANINISQTANKPKL